MDDALRMRGNMEQNKRERSDETGGEALYGGWQGEPVVVAVIQGPINAEMALDALKDQGIPAMLRRNPVASAYGFAGGFGGGVPLLVPEPMLEAAQDVLIGMGLLPGA
ncbi:MAG: hypothetical protein NVS4B8_13270 [Herpetosiphon sp.]